MTPPKARGLKRGKRKKFCPWVYNETDDFYETSCNNGWMFTEGTVKQNKVRFCPYCGKLVVAIRKPV
jgi:hypothetical protein